MNLISLTPSLTETLLLSGANVVGRSRYCIYPTEQVKVIPKVGGTKDIKWEELRDLKPDLIILDREENTREMAESCPYPYIDLHIADTAHVAPELDRLAQRIASPPLQAIAERWRKVIKPPLPLKQLTDLPGMVSWWREPTTQTRVEYLIWKAPWMAIGPDTFIHSMLQQMGAGDYLLSHEKKYPTIELEALDPAETVLLFSTEPYPFAKHKEALLDLGFSCGLIEAEYTSWYGIRSLEFLESLA